MEPVLFALHILHFLCGRGVPAQHPVSTGKWWPPRCSLVIANWLPDRVPFK